MPFEVVKDKEQAPHLFQFQSSFLDLDLVIVEGYVYSLLGKNHYYEA
jgi:hypothetical protein